MRKVALAATAATLLLIALAGCTTTQETASGAATGAVVGAAVGGPVGAVAGGVVGAATGPTVAQAEGVPTYAPGYYGPGRRYVRVRRARYVVARHHRRHVIRHMRRHHRVRHHRM